MKEKKYRYGNLPIPGGGYVTGFLFHPKKEKVLYLRTDIGGNYRFDYGSQTWRSLSEKVNMLDLAETYPIAIATDPSNADSLYAMSGTDGAVDENGAFCGKLSVSLDGGKTFESRKVPFYVHGNMNGRGTGFRLIKDPSRENTFYFASQKDGLLRTRDLGESWERLKCGGEQFMTFVWCSEDGKVILAGTAGVTTGNERFRGHSLYISYDGGENFEPLPMPENREMSKAKWNGYVAQRYDYDGTYFYCTLSCTGKNAYITDVGYSCDCGDVVGGRILRYSFDKQGKISGYTDITPRIAADEKGIYEVTDQALSYGFGGISACPGMPGLLAVSTLCREEGDMLYLSRDYGQTWEVALFDLVIGNLHFETSYMKPEYNGGHSLLHWLSDVKINPFDPEEVWFNSGTGVFVSRNFLHEDRSFTDCCRGIEETVHLNVYSPVDGPVKALDIVGDLGGFAFEEFDKACENSFADRQGNRYITCINADFSDSHPENVIATPRGNWKGKTKGGLILSQNYGLDFDRIPLPFGISDYLDERFHEIEKPNVNSGWAAMSSDAQTFVYGVADGIHLFMEGLITSNDRGKSFCKTRVFDLDGREITNSKKHLKVYADRVRPHVFYGFGDGMQIFVSTDAGRSFYQWEKPMFPESLCLGLINCANKTEIRGEAGKEGVFYAALGEYGLYKLTFRLEEKSILSVKLTKEGEKAYRVGLGVLSPQSSYLKDPKAIYLCGVIEDIYGFFRSFDDGKSWEKINDETQQFGDINSIDGDSRAFGRFLIATGSFGLKYGEEM